MVRFTAKQIPDQTGQVVIVTGGNSGIGLETARQLATRGARVYLAGRSRKRIDDAIEKIRISSTSTSPPDLRVLELDLQDLASVARAAESFKSQEQRLHLLINNAGIMGVPYAETKDGFELHWQTNYLSHFLFTTLLLPVLQSTAASLPAAEKSRVRVVNVSSDAATLFAPKFGLNAVNPNLKDLSGRMAIWNRYGSSKLAQVLHAHTLYESLKSSSGIATYSVHPGVVPTNLLESTEPGIMRTMIYYAIKLHVMPDLVTLEDGAMTTLFCATAPEANGEKYKGKMVKQAGTVNTAPDKWFGADLERELWTETERMLKERGF